MTECIVLTVKHSLMFWVSAKGVREVTFVDCTMNSRELDNSLSPEAWQKKNRCNKTTIQSTQQKSFTQVFLKKKNYEMPGLDQNTSVVESREM